VYSPSPFVCVDESSLSFRGRSSFCVYMPSKPAKYGLKVWCLCDVGTSFACNLQVYLGKATDGVTEKKQGARVVKDLVTFLFGSGRNVTTENFFTGYELGQFLLNKKMTLLGTIRKNRMELPKGLTPTKREPFESIFAFTHDTMLVSYSPKRNKTVVVISTMHNQVEIDENLDSRAKKPYAVLDYNSTKGAVDTFDQMIGAYSCARQTNRWPMRLFYFIIDTACVNAFVAFGMQNPNWNNHWGSNRLDKRRLFLLELGETLTAESVHRRAENRMVSGRPQIASAMPILGVNVCYGESPVAIGKKRKKCAHCPRTKEQKVANRCSLCHAFVCGIHSRKTTAVECWQCPNQCSDDDVDKNDG
jgi:Transposase IS4